MDEVLDYDTYLEDCRLKAATKVFESVLSAEVTGAKLSDKSQEIFN